VREHLSALPIKQSAPLLNQFRIIVSSR